MRSHPSGQRNDSIAEVTDCVRRIKMRYLRVLKLLVGIQHPVSYIPPSDNDYYCPNSIFMLTKIVSGLFRCCQRLV